MSCNTPISTCNTCYQPQPVCCCPKPVPPPPPVRTCKSPFDFFFGEILHCYLDQPCQNTNCTSPIAYAINTAKAQAASSSFADFITSWNTLLDAGLVTSNTGNKPLCCPGCCGDEIYFLGGVTPYTTVQDNIDYAPNCCLNSKVNAANSTVLNNFFKNRNWSIPVKCDNTFEACVSLLFTKVNNQSTLLTSGIVELPSAGFKTEICNLTNALTALTPTPTSTNIGSFMSNLLTKGVVFACVNGQIFIGSADAFVTWNNANS